MLQFWGAAATRPTRDIDLLGRGALTSEQLTAVVADCMKVPVPADALVFDESSIAISEIREQERYGGLRAEFRAALERMRIKMQLDVGLGDVITPNTIAVTYPCLLDLPAPELIGYPVETTIAEKLEALVDLGLANSRMKDFFDLFSLLGALELDGKTVAAAVQATFRRRGTEIPSVPPIGVTETFASEGDKRRQWSAFARRIRLSHVPDLLDVVTRLRSFTMPVFDAVRTGVPLKSRWRPEIGWRD
jgi:hypothetical protein